MNFDWPSSSGLGRPGYMRVTIVSTICFFLPLMLFFILALLVQEYRWGRGEIGGLLIAYMPFLVPWPIAFCSAIAGLIMPIVYARNCHSRRFPVFCACINGAILLVFGLLGCVFLAGFRA